MIWAHTPTSNLRKIINLDHLFQSRSSPPEFKRPISFDEGDLNRFGGKTNFLRCTVICSDFCRLSVLSV